MSLFLRKKFIVMILGNIEIPDVSNHSNDIKIIDSSVSSILFPEQIFF
jgi:hypothetical protein